MLFVRFDLEHLVFNLGNLILERFKFLGVTRGLSLDLTDLATNLVLLLSLLNFLVIKVLHLFFQLLELDV